MTRRGPEAVIVSRGFGRRNVVYWVATTFVAFNALVAGTFDILQMQPLFGIVLDHGYPGYFATILGTWKVLGALALLAPGYPRLKEWAYAGSTIDYTSAVVSYIAIGDMAAASLSGPVVSLVMLATSWALRRSSRRLAGPLI